MKSNQSSYMVRFSLRTGDAPEESVFDKIGSMLLPELKKRGFSDADIGVMLETNPARLWEGCKGE